MTMCNQQLHKHCQTMRNNNTLAANLLAISGENPDTQLESAARAACRHRRRAENEVLADLAVRPKWISAAYVALSFMAASHSLFRSCCSNDCLQDSTSSRLKISV